VVGGVEPPPGLVCPAVLSGPLGRPKAVRRSVAQPRPRDAEGRSFHPPRRGRQGLVERLTEQPTSGPCSTDESVVSHPPLPAERHSFLPWALFPFKVPSGSASIRLCQAGGRPFRPNRGSASAGPVRAVRRRRTASGGRAIEIPFRVSPLRRAEAQVRGAARGPKPSPAAPPFQRGRGTPVGASCRRPSTEAEVERRDGARKVCPGLEVVRALVCDAPDTPGVARRRQPL
jgi:hypothetical protein